MAKWCTNKNHSYKHNEQINTQNIDNSEFFGVKYAKIYLEMTSQYCFEKIWFWLDCWCNALLLPVCDHVFPVGSQGLAPRH
jgi:hypothetical protein